MIDKNTLFILGAGASQPYGYPLGSELRKLICDLNGEHNSLVHHIASEGTFTKQEIINFAEQFRRSGTPSIDKFLSGRSDLVSIGKLIIGAVLSVREDPDKIFSVDNEDHWYSYLWNALTDDASTGEELRRNKVRFITFNYDRSLEFFLHEATKATYKCWDNVAFDYWSHFEIAHAYGRIGDTNFADVVNVMPYAPGKTPQAVMQAGRLINIIPEDRDGDQIFQVARQWFDWAKHVYILGFGFDRMNCERLNFSSVIENKKANNQPLPEIHASVLDLTGKERDVAKERLIGVDCSWITHYKMNLKTLRHAGLPEAN